MSESSRPLRILVTGGSRGLGRALAHAAARVGHEVALVGRTPATLEGALALIREDSGRAHAIVGDVGRPDDALRIAHEAAARLGGIDVLVHVASTLGPVPLRPLLDIEPEELEAVFHTNLVGPFRLTRAVLGPMILRRSGTVVFVSSDAAVEAYPGWGAYGASKTAADHLARTFAAELERTGVRVFAIDPGEMDTDMHADAIPDADRSTLARPEDVAIRLLAAITRPALAPSGTRVVAGALEVSP